MKIHGGMMTQNEASDLIPNLERMLPHVDTFTITDNGSNDLTLFYLRNWAKKEPKLRVFLHPWEDNFPKSRNYYVNHTKEVAQPGDWMLHLDADEYLEDKALEKLRPAVERAERDGCNMVGFQCRSVSLEGPHRVWENVDQHWKQILIKWDPNFHYTGNLCHEGMGGVPHNIMRTNLIYEHRKQNDIIWLRGYRNLVVGGGGPNLGKSNPRWLELLDIMAKLDMYGWHAMYKAMVAGNLHQSIKDWMLKYYNLEGFDGSSEHREAALSYWVLLHPEECRDLSPELQEYFRSKGAVW